MSTYILIQSQTLASSAASVTFSSIPSTYTDLALRLSARNDGAGTRAAFGLLQFNSDTTANYSATYTRGTGTFATSANFTTASTPIGGKWSPTGYDSAGNTANTFTNTEIYIPNYATTATKSYSAFNVSEDNSTGNANGIEATANLYLGTTAISSILILSNSGNFVAGSSFYLYGISNS